MIGFFDYTVWLTYLSLLSAAVGIGFSLHGMGHPYWGVFFLMICGLCDAFDGRIARTKKNRTPEQRAFGIQIDSLSDLVAFGVLPACIGESLATLGPVLTEVPKFRVGGPIGEMMITALTIGILLFYVLAAMIRLAYFNVVEEDRQETERGSRKSYVGLPVTSAALIFPTILLLQYVLPIDISVLYYISLLVTGILFLLKINVEKPGLKGILFLVGIGALEGILLLISMFVIDHIHY